MKHLLLIITLLSFQASSQINLPFPDSTGAWVYTDVWYGGGFGPDIFSSYRHYLKDEVTINTQTYREVYNGHFDILDTNAANDLLLGYCRIDGQKVYYLPVVEYVNGVYVDTFEFLMYDFGMQIGDTLLYTFGPNQFGAILETIDTVQFNGNDYRRFYVSFFDGMYLPTGTYWYEGMGSEEGFYPWFSYYENSHTLHCFHENGESWEFNLAGGTDCWDVPLAVEYLSNKAILIYPNPVVDVLMIQTDLIITDYSVIDVSGRRVHSGEITNNSIDLLGVNEGHYYLELIDVSGNIFLEKIVVK